MGGIIQSTHRAKKSSSAGFVREPTGLYLALVLGLFALFGLMAMKAYSSVHSAGYSLVVSWGAAIGVVISPAVLALMCGIISAIFLTYKYPHERFDVETVTSHSFASLLVIAMVAFLCGIGFLAIKPLLFLFTS